MISLLCDSNSHNASNSHKKEQSVTLSLPLHLHCDGKTIQEVPRSIYFPVERKGNSNKLISTCLKEHRTVSVS